MALYKIDVQFLGGVEIDATFRGSDAWLWVFKSARTANFEVKTNSISGSEMAYRMLLAFNEDVYTHEDYSPSTDGDVFTYYIDDSETVIANIDTTSANIVITKTVVADSIHITDAHNRSNTSGAGYCVSYAVDVRASLDIDRVGIEIGTGGESISDEDTPSDHIRRNLERGNGVMTVTVYNDATGTSDSRTLERLPYLSFDQVSVEVESTPLGNFTKITTSTPEKHKLLYRIDNAGAWLPISEITALDDGARHFEIQDEGKCTITKDITVTDFTQTEYFHVPKVNSVRFGNENELKIPESFKANQSTNEVNYDNCQQYLKTDEIKIQYRSGYPNNDLHIHHDNGASTLRTSIKKTENLGVKYSLKYSKQVIIEELTGALYKVGLIFNDNIILDYDTGVMLDVYHLDGKLPEFAKLGNYFMLGTEIFLIDDLRYNDDEEAWMIVIDRELGGTDIIKTIYNKKEYEVYEVLIRFSDFVPIGLKYMTLVVSGGGYPTKTAFSDYMNISESETDTHELVYWSDTNKASILYSTGIKHLKRLLVENITETAEGDSEILKGDDTVYSYNKEHNEKREFLFSRLPIEQMRSLEIALKSDNVVINGQPFKASDVTPEQIGYSNMYNIIASLYKSENKQIG